MRKTLWWSSGDPARSRPVGADLGVGDRRGQHQKLRNAVTVNGILQHERVLPADRQQQRRHPGVGHAGLRRLGRLRGRAAEPSRLQGHDPGVHVPVLPELAPASWQQVSPTPTDYETGTFDYSGSGDVTGEVVPVDQRRHPADAGAEQHLRLRGGRLPAGAGRAGGRADPARHLRLRGQGRQRRGRRLRRGDHLQRGQPGPHRPVHRHPRRPADHPGGGSELRRRRRPATTQIAGRPGHRPGDHLDRGRPGRARPTTSSPTRPKGKNSDQVVVVGAHLDSVIEGPGINDNGSGSVDDPGDRRGDGGARLHQEASCSARCASPSGAPRRPTCSARSTTSTTSPRPAAVEDLRQPELRHARLAELRAVRLRR